MEKGGAVDAGGSAAGHGNGAPVAENAENGRRLPAERIRLSISATAEEWAAIQARARGAGYWYPDTWWASCPQSPVLRACMTIRCRRSAARNSASFWKRRGICVRFFLSAGCGKLTAARAGADGLTGSHHIVQRPAGPADGTAASSRAPR